MTGDTMGYQVSIDRGCVRICNGKHVFTIDAYCRKVEINEMALYYLDSDEARETLNELLNREEITPEEMNYLRGVSLLDYRGHKKWLERFRDRPIGKLKRAVLLSYILGSDWEGEKKRLWLIRNGYSEGELRARKIAHELLEDDTMLDTYYACACPGRKLKKGKIELKYPSDALPMVADYLNERYEIIGFVEDEEGCLQSIPLKFHHRGYDNEKGYLLLLDPWGGEIFGVSVIFEEEDIYWPWVERWGEEIFELHLLPKMKDDWFEWCWKDNKPGEAAKVWRKLNLLEAYRWHYDRIGGAWGKRYAKLLAEMLLEERMEELLGKLKRENLKEYAKTLAEMLERRPRKYILQVDGSNHLGEDGDGNPLFEIPPEGLCAWIQDENGNPTAGDRYIRLRIKRDGGVEAELQFGGEDGNPAESEGGNNRLPKCPEAAVAGSGERPLREPTPERPCQILPVLRPDVGHPPHSQDGGARERLRRRERLQGAPPPERPPLLLLPGEGARSDGPPVEGWGAEGGSRHTQGNPAEHRGGLP
jgi:hypothetical protein